MTQVAGSPGEYALSSLNAETGWIELHGLKEDPGFTITGTFVGTITLRVSNQGVDPKTRYREPATYAVPAGPLAIPRANGRWFNFVMTAYTSGAAYIGISAPDGGSSGPGPQVQTNNPTGDQF